MSILQHLLYLLHFFNESYKVGHIFSPLPIHLALVLFLVLLLIKFHIMCPIDFSNSFFRIIL